VLTEEGHGKAGKPKAAFQLSHRHGDYEMPLIKGCGFKGQSQNTVSTFTVYSLN